MEWVVESVVGSGVACSMDRFDILCHTMHRRCRRSRTLSSIRWDWGRSYLSRNCLQLVLEVVQGSGAEQDMLEEEGERVSLSWYGLFVCWGGVPLARHRGRFVKLLQTEQLVAYPLNQKQKRREVILGDLWRSIHHRAGWFVERGKQGLLYQRPEIKQDYCTTPVLYSVIDAH